MAEQVIFFTAGDLAKKYGVSPTAIRNWDARGWLEPDARTRGGIKLYSDAALAKLDERRGS